MTFVFTLYISAILSSVSACPANKYVLKVKNTSTS